MSEKCKRYTAITFRIFPGDNQKDWKITEKGITLSLFLGKGDYCRFTCSLRNNTERLILQFAQFPPMVTFCKAIMYHCKDIDIDHIQSSSVLFVLIGVYVVLYNLYVY